MTKPRRGTLSRPAHPSLCEADHVPPSREVSSVYTGGRSDEQEDFPRGGQGALSALEKRLIREKAEQEVLFSEVQPIVQWQLLSQWILCSVVMDTIPYGTGLEADHVRPFVMYITL